MEFTAELVLAVIAAATGTLAILGIIGFFVFVCHHHRVRRQRRREADRKHRGGDDSLPDITSPNDTSSAMTNDDSNELETDIEAVLDLEDHSVITKTHSAKVFPRVRSAQDMESCYGDDNWSYAVTEEGSVLVSQELSFKKQSLHPPSTSGNKSPNQTVCTTPVAVYFRGDQNGTIMYEV